jgi:DNA sulfur modification protein DndD
MILNEIQLTNIGPYRGINSFDFRPDNGKNVILIGGENGAGKTTLLNAIKIGLFGSYGYGAKSSTEYTKTIVNILNHLAKKNDENNFRIKLQFSLIDDFEKIDYILYRSWNYVNQNLKESFELVANEKHLSDYDKEVFQSKLKEIMPPQLLDLCLFDGEEIARIINEDLLSDYLKNLTRVVFNLDLFETLENDLETYSSQSLDSKKIESSEQDLNKLKMHEEDIRKKIISTNANVHELISKKEELHDEYHVHKNNFEKYGGLVKTERDNIIRQINVIDNIRKQNLDKIREFVINLLPFYLTKNLLLQTREQIQNEEAFQLFRQLEDKLTDEKLNKILESISSSSGSQELKIQLLSLVKPEYEINQIHGASFSESSLVENMYLKISDSSIQDCFNFIEENKTKLVELQVLREKLKVNDSSNEFSEMIEKMEVIQQSILKLEASLVTEETQLKNLISSLDETIFSIDKIQNVLRDSDKTKSSFIESQNIILLSRKFRDFQLKKKIQEVQIEATGMIKKLFRKHNYVSSVLIDAKTYDVVLLDSQKEQIEKSTLSAGEKEILLISIIWAIFKCSGRKVPFIFDTLLGRLDKTHKAAVLKEFIPSCAKQAIILSTDTEIDQAHYQLLKHNVAKEYMLEFNVEEKQTHILNQYFPFKQMELNI